MTTYILLHGGGHNGRCYDRFSAVLKKRGHAAIAPDMPYSDPKATLGQIADAVAALAPGEKDVVVAGHSMGGLIAPLVAARRPVTALVMLCAVVPEPGVSFVDQNLDPRLVGPSIIPRDALGPDAFGGNVFCSREVFHRYLYQDCPISDVDDAWERTEAYATNLAKEPSPLKAWPSVPTLSVISTEDRAVNPPWSRDAAKRVGATVVELQGCSHSPFMSRPEALADVLCDFAERSRVR